MEDNRSLVATLDSQEDGLPDIDTEALACSSFATTATCPHPRIHGTARVLSVFLLLTVAAFIVRGVDSRKSEAASEPVSNLATMATLSEAESLDCMCTDTSSNPNAVFRPGNFGKRGICSTGSRGCCIGLANVYCGLDVAIPHCLPTQLCPAGNRCPDCGAPDGHCPCAVPPHSVPPHAQPSPSPRPRRACSAMAQDCRTSKCCSGPNLRCFEKTSQWATCKPSCSPGVDYNDAPQWQQPWSCKVLDAALSLDDVPDCSQVYPNSCQADWIDHKDPIAEAFYCESGDAVGGCRHGPAGPFHPAACAKQCYFSPLMVQMKRNIENGEQA